MKRYLWTILLILPILVQADSSSQKRRGKLIKLILEENHFSRLRFDDRLSQRAFSIFIDSLDPSKMYFLQSDIQELKQYLTDIDDQIVSGNYRLLDRAFSIMKERIAQAEKLGKELFAGSFDFTRDEVFETDFEKRGHPKDAAEFRERWRKFLKFNVLGRYTKLVTEEEGQGLDDKQLIEKAYERGLKAYENIFRRLHEKNYPEFLNDFYNSVTKSFDPHTIYFSPDLTDRFQIEISNSMEGIGIRFSKENIYPEVVDIVIGGPAWKQGELEPGDLLLSIVDQEGKTISFVDKNKLEIASLIVGKAGTVAVLNVKKIDGTTKTVSIVRDSVMIKHNTVKSFVLGHKDMDERVGYMILPAFYQGSARDVLVEIKRLRSKNISGLILDLRNNAGGSLDDVAHMVGLFIETGPIVQIYNFNKSRFSVMDKDPQIHYRGPLVVMINGTSASASEILSGAIQDYKRGVVVGQNSFGKGTVQVVADLNRRFLLKTEGMGSMKITTQVFYRITGVPFQDLGVTPDVVLPNPNPGFKVSERALDYSLSVGPIPSSRYNMTLPVYYDIPQLQKHSRKRVENSKYFQNMAKREREFERTNAKAYISLNKNKAVEERIRNQERQDRLNADELKNGLIVSVDKEGIFLGEQMDISKENEKKWEKALQEKKENWVEKIHQDFLLEESMYIMKDILEGMDPGSKKSMR